MLCYEDLFSVVLQDRDISVRALHEGVWAQRSVPEVNHIHAALLTLDDICTSGVTHRGVLVV